MGKEIKKGKRGSAAEYYTRSQAIRKLQVTLNDFRRLCILKGIYPREPKKKFKGSDKTYYHRKDIHYLMHDQLLEKFRNIKSHMRKYRRAIYRGDKTSATTLIKNKPTYSLHYVLKERYPTFPDALRDMDDALTLLSLFASFPSHESLNIRIYKRHHKHSTGNYQYVPKTGHRILFIRGPQPDSEQSLLVDQRNLLSNGHTFCAHHLDSAIQIHS